MSKAQREHKEHVENSEYAQLINFNHFLGRRQKGKKLPVFVATHANGVLAKIALRNWTVTLKPLG